MSASVKPRIIEILDVEQSPSSIHPPTTAHKLNDSFKSHACTVKIHSNHEMDKIFFQDMVGNFLDL